MLEGPCLLAKGQCKPSLSSAGKMAQKEHHRESEPRPWCSVGLSAIRTPWHSNAVSALWFLLVMTGTPALETLGFKCFYQHIQPKKTGWLIQWYLAWFRPPICVALMLLTLLKVSIWTDCKKKRWLLLCLEHGASNISLWDMHYFAKVLTYFDSTSSAFEYRLGRSGIEGCSCH